MSLTADELVAEIERAGLKVSVEGDDILISGDRARFDPGWKPLLQALKPRILRLLRPSSAGRTLGTPTPPSTDLGTGQIHPVSYQQELVWRQEQLGRIGQSNNLLIVQRVKDHASIQPPHELPALLARRHDALRLEPFEHEHGVAQRLVAPDPPRLTVAHLGTDTELQNYLDNLRHVRLLGRGVPAQFHWVTTPREGLFIILVHDILVDGRSAQILAQEVQAWFEGAPVAPADEAAPARYLDYCAWQRSDSFDQALEAGIEYWREKAEPWPGLLAFARIREVNASDTYRFASSEQTMPEPALQTLKNHCERLSCSPFMVIFSAYAAALYKYTRCTEFAIGVPFEGRGQAPLQNVVGHFVNTIPLVVRLRPHDTLADLIRQVRRTTLEGLMHQHVPYRLIDEVVVRHGARPLFNVMLQLGSDDSRQQSGLPALGGRTASGNFDLTLSVSMKDDAHFRIEYDRNAVLAVTALGILGQTLRTLHEIELHEPRTLHELAAGTPQETTPYRSALRSLPPQREAHAKNHTALDRIVATAAASPDRLAIQSASTRLSYGELLAQAQAVCTELRLRGIGQGDLVALCGDREPAMVATLLGILLAGAAYLPLDPRYPTERIAYIVGDAAPALILDSESARLPALAGGRCAVADYGQLIASGQRRPEPARSFATLDGTAYVLYTSGSTGRPKGVRIGHRSLVRFIEWILADIGEPAHRVTLFSTSICFDISVYEMFAPLSCGGSILIVQDALETIGDHLAETISLVNTVPSSVAAMCAARTLPPRLEHLVIAGEPLHLDLVRRVRAQAPQVTIRNLYGPTEDTIFSTLYEVPPYEGCERIPIGRPKAGTSVAVCDPDLQVVPAGALGELLLMGDGLALGYLDAAETARRFVRVELQGQRVRAYRTGDLVCCDEQGVLHFFHRADKQVKVNGYRIELGEIEAVVKKLDGVEDCAVTALRSGQGAMLVAAYVAKAVDVATLRSRLGKTLPFYMVPNRYVRLDALPRTPSGKVDAAAVAQMASRSLDEVAPRAADESLAERAVAEAWEQVLGHRNFGPQTSFFDAGGSSLTAFALVMRLKDLGIDTTVRRFLANPTVRSLASHGPTAGRQAADQRPDEDLDVDLTPPPAGTTVAPLFVVPRRVLLLGSTGFLGRHVLRELLVHSDVQVVCIVRPTESGRALDRGIAALAAAGDVRPEWLGRLRFLEGDKTREWLGLTQDVHRDLARSVDLVIDSSAQVNMLYAYSHLRRTNLDALSNVIDFCTRDRVKPLHHVSTLAVKAMGPHGHRLRDFHATRNGYVKSKLAAEFALARHSAARGVPVHTYRPSRITGSTERYAANPQDLFERILRACMRLRLAPGSDRRVDFVPVDLVARAIVRQALQHEQGCGDTDLCTPFDWTWNQFIDQLRQAGAGLQTVDYADWLQAVLQRGTDAGLSILLQEMDGPEFEIFCDLPPEPAGPPAGGRALALPDGRAYVAALLDDVAGSLTTP